MTSKVLMVFVRNAVLGKVKTRLAATMGEQKALEIYLNLLLYTRNITKEISAQKVVYYSDKLEENDAWLSEGFEQKIQRGSDLGERMKNAFQEQFAAGFSKVIIIGSDCLELTSDIIENAFSILDYKDVVLGPAADGGYYLLGMKKLHPSLFGNKIWGCDTVMAATIQDIINDELSFELLPILNDIDEERDYIMLEKRRKVN